MNHSLGNVLKYCFVTKLLRNDDNFFNWITDPLYENGDSLN